jgi:hypothetical protein
MSKALIFALLFAGLPAAYADENGVGDAVGAIVRAPFDAAAASSAA